jgi:hypothetical protein
MAMEGSSTPREGEELVGWVLGELVKLPNMLLLQRRHGSVGRRRRWCGINIAL